MSKGPGLFSHFGRQARDVLRKDYNFDQKFTIATESETGVALASTALKKGGLSSGDVAAQYKYKSALVDVKADTDSNISTTLTVSDIPASTKTIASCKFPDYNSGKIEFQYFHEHVSLTTAVDLKKFPNVDLSATIGTPGVAFGTEATYKLSNGNFIKYNAGVSLNKPNFSASVILADKGDAISVSYLYYLEQLKRGAVVGEINRKFSTKENTLTVGCSCKVDPHTTVKARLDNHGQIAALMLHELMPMSFVTISGAFDTKAMQKTPRFGLALSLKP